MEIPENYHRILTVPGYAKLYAKIDCSLCKGLGYLPENKLRMCPCVMIDPPKGLEGHA